VGKTIFIGARKGGVGKSMTAASLGVGFARQGKRVLCLDADAQHS
jgi:chromosome partitioning protein